MPTFRHGKNAVIKLATVGTPTVVVDVSNTARSVAFPRPIDVAETSAFGTQNKTYVTGMQGQTMSVEGEWDATVDAQFSALLGSEVQFAWQYGPESATTGRVRYSQPGTGTPINGAIVTNYNVSSPVSDMVSYTLDLQISGTVTRDTWP